ncbi:MAG: DNA polymerase III subunit [Planctomycetes bacterium]|nr:DNA polymerase III subunit [Planctomycetota bacterium]
MSFDSVVGHARVVEHLRSLLTADRLPHACLLHGEEGIGKYCVARYTALARLCSAAPADACGRCHDCRLGLAGAHPDLHALDEPEAVSLRIEQIRELIALSARTPYRARGRTFLVRDAHRLTEEAQNALLKTLEEPPPGCVLLLTSGRPEGLLPTIRSRCQEFGMRPLSIPDATTVLERSGCPPERVGLLARISGGAPGKALALEAGGFLELRAALLDLVGGDAADPLETAEQVLARVKTGETGVRGRTEMLVELWISVLRDLLVLGVGAADTLVWHHDLEPRLGAVAARRTPRELETRIEAAGRALRALAVNASAELVLSDLALALA